MVAFDTTVLSVLLFPDAEVRSEGQLVPDARERVQALVAKLQEAKEQVLVPTPALCEVLVTEGADVGEVLETLRNSAYIKIAGFDERAAVELAIRLRDARKAGQEREGLKISKGAMKFDRQIVAIALVNGARVLYSDDAGLKKFAEACGIDVKRVADLAVPPSQSTLPFDDNAPSDPVDSDKE